MGDLGKKVMGDDSACGILSSEHPSSPSFLAFMLIFSSLQAAFTANAYALSHYLAGVSGSSSSYSVLSFIPHNHSHFVLDYSVN